MDNNDYYSYNILHCGKIWRALNLANPYSEHIGEFSTTDTDCTCIMQYLAISANSLTLQVKNPPPHKIPRSTVMCCFIRLAGVLIIEICDLLI